MMRNDPAHKATEKELKRIEKQLAKEYRKAHKDVTAKLDSYLERFKSKDAQWQKWVADGVKTPKEYQEWRMGQMLVGERWADMRDSIAKD